jgi:glucuronate isomerase
MATREPSPSPNLARRIERLIDETPIVDPHTHVRCDQPTAPDLAALMSYHWVQTELRAVGMPPADLDPALPPDERVRRSIPYLRRMRNTAMAWCLYQIFRDLYDFDAREVTESNYRDLIDKVARTGQDPDWAPHIFRDRCNIRTIVTSLGNRSADPAKNPANVLYMLDVHYLFCPGVATDLTPFFAGRTTKGEYYDALAAVLGERLATPDRLARQVRDWLDRTVTGPVRFSNTFIPIEQRFLAPDESRVRTVLGRAAAGEALSDSDIDTLVRFVSWEVLGWHHDHRKAFQIAVGAEYFICDGKSIPRFQETWTSEMARAFHHFGAARFDLMMASDVLTHETAVLARQFPNVYVSGYWWHNFFPATIARIVGLRLQMAPMTKVGGFLCDAYYAEWTYGKLQIVKRAMAAALASLVEAGFADEDALPPLLHQILHDTPRDLYDLGPRP